MFWLRGFRVYAVYGFVCFCLKGVVPPAEARTHTHTHLLDAGVKQTNQMNITNSAFTTHRELTTYF